ncbi:MAG: hypothetical protein JWQ04_2818 [Pedosphaera sp.]|nr:hypothetical protein [Pedosphaera sp.]
MVQLNREIRRGRYSDKIFFKATGKKLDELWVEFKGTPAFTPTAVEINAFHVALGYVNGQPPGNVQARFESYLKEHQDDVKAAHRVLGYVDGKPPKDVVTLYDMSIYMSQPAGKLTRAAGEFMLNLQRNGQLPGFSKGEKMKFDLPDDGYSEAYPICRTFRCSKDGDPFLYNYKIVRATKESPWELQKGWKTGQGRIMEEFPILTKAQ